MAKQYDKKYGVESDLTRVKEHHISRRMFAIKDNILFLAPKNADYSHAEWFEIQNWISSNDDLLMEKITRGYVDATGIYFYKGYDFRLDEKSEKEMLLNLELLVKELRIDTDLHIFGGIIKLGTKGEKWPPKKDYGLIKDLLILRIP